MADYAELPDLLKTKGDAQGYAGLLRDDLAFDEVVLVEDPARVDFLARFGAFLDGIAPGDEVFFIFSGHGWSDGAENYLVLADAPKSAPQYVVKLETVALNTAVLRQINDRQPRAVIAIIDACRDNPFEGLTRSGMSRGLTRVDPGRGTLVMFSAGTGQTALDRLSFDDPSPYSVFTRTLLPRLREDHRPLQDIARDVKSEVLQLASTIRHDQLPAYYDELLGDYCLSGTCAPADGPAAIAPDTQLWLDVTAGAYAGEVSCAGYQRYLDAFPQGEFAERARRLLSFPPCSDEIKSTDADTARFLAITAGEQSDSPAEVCSAYERYLTDFPQGQYRARVLRLLGAPPCVPTGTSVEFGAAAGPDLPLVDVTVLPTAPMMSRKPSFIDGAPLTFEGFGAYEFYAAADDGAGGIWAAGPLRTGGTDFAVTYLVHIDAGGNTTARHLIGFPAGGEMQALDAGGPVNPFAFTRAHAIEALLADGRGGVLLAGWVRPADGEGTAALMARLGPDGTITGSETLVQGYSASLSAIALRPNGIVFAGESWTRLPDGGSEETGLIIAVDAEGVGDWQATPKGMGGAAATSVMVSSLGEIWVAGRTRRRGNEAESVYFARISDQGELIEERAFPVEGTAEGIKLVPARDGRAWLVGEVRDSTNAPKRSDILITRLNAEGARSGQKTLTRGEAFLVISDAAADPQGGIWIAGTQYPEAGSQQSLPFLEYVAEEGVSAGYDTLAVRSPSAAGRALVLTKSGTLWLAGTLISAPADVKGFLQSFLIAG